MSAPAVPSAPVPTRSLALAFLAGAVVALLGALLWAVAGIATGYNLGLVAWLVGVAMGLTVIRVAGGPVGAFERGLVGVFAGCAIVVGFYVTWIHESNAHFHSSISYFDGDAISAFVHHFGRDVGIRPIDWLWILLAAFAAFRVSGSGSVLRRRHS